MKILTPSMRAPNTSGQWLIFAIGNPGEDFENSYHNAGILALPIIIETVAGKPMDALAWHLHKKLFAYAADGQFVFARSCLSMNESGRAASEAVKKFGVAPERLIVLHDDSDILQGLFKISFGRGSGGHHGAQSVIDRLKTKMFWRVRIGIRPAPAKSAAGTPVREPSRKKAGDFVLAKITPSARNKLKTAFKEASAELSKRIQYPVSNIQ
jgi:PTH1 family peptidyl-tRNA hydrolase